MAHVLNTFHYRGALGTRVNPDTIGRMYTGEFDLNTLRVSGEIFQSGKKSCGFMDTRGAALTVIWNHSNKRKIAFTANLMKLYTLN